MKPYYDSPEGQIHHGHALDVLRSMPAESVQMCVTSLNANLVEFFASKIKGFTLLEIFIRVCKVWDFDRLSVPTRKFTIASYFSSVFAAVSLKVSEFKNCFGGFFFNTKIWQQGLQNLFNSLIRCLIAIQRLAFFGAWFFFIIPTTEIFSNKFNCGFINHPNLNPCMVARANALLALVSLGLLYSYVSFTINQPGHISNINFFHSIVPLFVVYVIIATVLKMSRSINVVLGTR